MGTWGGSELAGFKQVCRASGVKIQFETTRDLDALLESRLKAGAPPDIAILPNPAMFRQLVKKGRLAGMYFLNRKKLLQDYSKTWIDLGRYAGHIFGLVYKVANKSLIWYNPQQFKKYGWPVPKTWNDLLSLTKKIRKEGKVPWSVGADIGWPLSDWIENIMLRTAGPRLYRDWVRHKIPWTHAAVKKAFLTWGQIMGSPANLLGGRSGTLATSFQNAAFKVFRKDPAAFLYFEGDFMGGIVRKELAHIKPGKNMAFFPFPDINPRFRKSVVGGADMIVAFKKTQKIKKLISFLASKKAHEIWVKRGGFISHNRRVPLSLYPDKNSRRSAAILTAARIFVFDGSDLMPPAVGNKGGFWDACMKYIQDPAKLDSILGDMEKKAAGHY